MSIPRESPIVNDVEAEEVNLSQLQLSLCPHVTNNQQGDLMRKHNGDHFTRSIRHQFRLMYSNGLWWLPVVLQSIDTPVTRGNIHHRSVSGNRYLPEIGFEIRCVVFTSVFETGECPVRVCAFSSGGYSGIYNNSCKYKVKKSKEKLCEYFCNYNTFEIIQKIYIVLCASSLYQLFFPLT